MPLPLHPASVQEPIPHVSIAWAIGDVCAQLDEALRGGQLNASAATIDVQVGPWDADGPLGGVVCRPVVRGACMADSSPVFYACMQHNVCVAFVWCWLTGSWACVMSGGGLFAFFCT